MAVVRLSPVKPASSWASRLVSSFLMLIAIFLPFYHQDPSFYHMSDCGFDQPSSPKSLVSRDA
jgi:hypothetical protein